jgi:activator of HSP90 ATPase
MPLKTRTITQTERIPGVKPVQVYDALVSPKKHAAFTGAAATGVARPGGEFTAWDGYITGKYVELDPPRRILQEWRTTEWPQGSPPSLVEWTFAVQGDDTEVTLSHSEVPASQAESYRQGWIDYYWTPLKKYFANKAR